DFHKGFSAQQRLALVDKKACGIFGSSHAHTFSQSRIHRFTGIIEKIGLGQGIVGHVGSPKVVVCPSGLIGKRVSKNLPFLKIFGSCSLDMNQISSYFGIGGIDVIVPVMTQDDRWIGKVGINSGLILLRGIIVLGILQGRAWVAGGYSSQYPAKEK